MPESGRTPRGTAPPASCPPVDLALDTSPLPLDEVLGTGELARRPSRAPDYRAENAALVSLVSAFTESPTSILHHLAESILEILHCDSTGVSLLDATGENLCWPAVAGVWQPHTGGGTPRHFGPCGDVLDRGTPLLFHNVEHRYTYLAAVAPPVQEWLLVPFFVNGVAVGTVWAITHTGEQARRPFDAEDLRLLTSLAAVASGAYQMIQQERTIDQRNHESATALREMNNALLVSSVKQEELVEQMTAANRLVVESRDRFESLFNESPISMVLVDAGLRIRLMSSDARHTFGGADGLAGHGLRESLERIWPADAARDLAAHFADALATGTPYIASEYRVERRDGAPVEFFDLQLHRITLHDGRFGVVCYFVDSTSRVILSNELRDHAAVLVASDLHKNEFLAMLAHELRNPLAPIRNALAIIRHAPHDTALIDSSSKMIDRQVRHMVRLVDDLLDVTRISQGKLQLKVGRIELASAVHEAVEAATGMTERMEQTLTVTLTDVPIFLDADPTRLAQVIGNLLNNASRYNTRGGSIHLSTERDGPDVVIRVRDTGIGMAPDQMPRIFDLFTQLDPTLARASSGLGIGLTLVKTLVEMHGGTIEARSGGLGQGSEFIVRLPVAAEAVAVAVVPSVPARTPPRRILVVDDNHDAATSLSMLLQLSGHTTQVAFDGIEVVDAAATFRPDMILLDLGMPNVNGYDACRLVRNQSWGREILIVALTGWGQDEDRQKTEAAGFDAHMVKPVNPDELLQLLADLPRSPQTY